MTASQPNLLELAKQGDARAIATMMNTALQPEGITIRAGFASDCLIVTAESQTPPDQADLVGFIRELLTDLNPARAKRVVVQGRVTGQAAPVWHEAFDLTPVEVEPEQEVAIAKPEEAVEPEPVIATPISAPSPQPPSPSREKLASKTSKKSFLIAGASLAVIALCLLIGKQAFEQTTSASNALTTPEQKAPLPEAATANSPQPSSTAPTQPKTETTLSLKTQPPVEAQATPKTTIVASLKPGTVAKNNTKSPSAKSNPIPAQGNREATLQTANKSTPASQPKTIPATTQKTVSKNNSCKSIHAEMNQKVYQQCLSHGMTRSRMGEVMGLPGSEMSRVGSVVTYKWANPENKVIATFHHDRLISKSLVKLP